MNPDLIRKAFNVNQANLALGNETFVADGGTFVRNRDVPSIRDANHVAHITASTPAEIERLMARVEREFDGFPHRRYDLDSFTSPLVEARLVLDGYVATSAIVMVLESALGGDAKAFEIRPVDDDAARDAIGALFAKDWAEYRTRASLPEEAEVGRQMARTRLRKAPAVQYFLAYAEGEPRGYFSSWQGDDGVGQVEDLFVLAEWRHRGIATALLHHCVADCRAKGAGAVVIVADPTDTPMRMYAAMGWVPVGIKREYRRDAEAK